MISRRKTKPDPAEEGARISTPNILRSRPDHLNTSEQAPFFLNLQGRQNYSRPKG